MKKDSKKIAVLIPCYNESKTVAKVIKDYKKALPEADIYVYDNNSTDGTDKIAEKAGAIVKYEYRQGKGNVIRSMFRDIDADCYLMIDGDDTYPAENAKEMCDIVLNGRADMVIGDRLSSTYFTENKRPFHNLGNKMVRFLINKLFKNNVKDIMTGYRAFSYEFVKAFPVLSKGFEIETEILFDNKTIKVQRQIIEDKIFKYNLDICTQDEIKYWSPESPNLYDINYKLYYNGNLIDEVSSYFGVRKISIENSKILLNNEEIYLKMILDQGYWADSHLTPPTEEAIIKDIEIVKKYGYNGIRKHQKIEDERFLYYCDINGILVWSEMANCYEFNDKSIEYITDEWIKVVKQNYNHPSIITWVPINESWGIREVSENIQEQDFANSLYYITKAIDKTRPVISNDGWEHTISDIITIHDYKQDADLLYNEYNDKELAVLNNQKAYNTIHKLFSGDYKYNGQPIIMSEYGGIALSSDKGWGYGKQVIDENEYLDRFAKLTKVIKNTKYICGYCYTQLTDVQQEINGLVDENRNDKFSNEIINAINSINKS